VYWTVYGIFAILDHVPFRMAENVQLYWLFKAVGLFYLSLPEVKIAAKIFLYKVISVNKLNKNKIFFLKVEPWVVKIEKLIERPKKEKDVVSKGGKEKEVPSKGVKEVVSKGGKEVASKGSKSKNK